MNRRTVAILILITFQACSQEGGVAPPVEPPLYFPPATGTWESKTPSSLGWNLAKLEELTSFIEASNSRAFIILHNGNIVVEKYFGKEFNGTTNFSATSNWYWASAGKTLTAALVGIAESQNKLEFDAKTSDYLGAGWTSLSSAQENKITVRHQLTMTTGLNDGVSNADCTQPSCLQFKAEPDARWAYHNAPYTLLDGVLANTTGKSLNTFLNEQIKNRVGMDGQYITTGDNNVYYSTARSMARFGLLLLNRGNWNGIEIIPETYHSLITTTSQNLNLSYGYLTWLNGKPSSMVPGSQLVFPASIAPNAPPDMFAAMGKNGQLINVAPSENIVVIRMGDIPDNSLVPLTFQNDMWALLKQVIRP
jgi:CubicO group peptidase (beta-lactamase class C family)